MLQPNSDTSTGLDGLIVGCLIAASILVMSSLASASLGLTAIVLFMSLLLLALYMRRTRKAEPEPNSFLNDEMVRNVRSNTIESLVATLPRAVAVLDRNGEVVFANDAAKSMLSADMLGRPISAYLRSSELRPSLERAFSGETVPPLPIRILAPTERVVDVDFSSPMTFPSEHQKNDVILAVIADRTQSRLAREKRADFLANASHELKTPIASLKGYIETLRGHAKDDPEARELFLGIMQDQTDRMERLVTDLLSLRKIESSEHIAPSEIADLRDALEAVQDVLRPLAETKNVELSIKLPDSGPAVIFGKTDECIQLFLNLVENAIKLSPPQTTVEVTLDYLPKWTGEAFQSPIRRGATLRRIVNLAPSSEPAWRVVVSDSGPGFSRAHLPRIGERFYRVAGDLPAQEKGTGLGLAIVKHVVLRHRAGLFVQSAHRDNPVYFGQEAGKSVEEPGTAFSVVFAATEDKAKGKQI